jgi:dihydrofolate reductase
MRKLIVQEFVTLDGVAQAPGGPDEDPEGGFRHGGWHMRFMDDLAGKWVDDAITTAGGFVLGRRTYEIFAAYWPNAPAEEAEIARPLNTLPKYVASRTLTEPLAWQSSQLLRGDVASAIRALKQEDGGDLVVIGSIKLVWTLLEHELVEELRLMVDPIAVGGGKRLFADDGRLRKMRLIEGQTTTTGAVLTRYAVT